MRAAKCHDLPIKSPSSRHDLTNKQFVIEPEWNIEPGLTGLFVCRASCCFAGRGEYSAARIFTGLNFAADWAAAGVREVRALRPQQGIPLSLVRCRREGELPLLTRLEKLRAVNHLPP